MKHRIVFSYEEEESLPILMSLPNHHKLKEKNTFIGETTKTVKNGKYFIVRTRIGYDETENQIHNKIDIFLTYTADEGFLRGFVYNNGKEYPILDYKTYNSLQIEQFCYDKITAIRLPNDFSF